MHRTLVAAALALALFGAITWYALEGSEVVVVRTRGADGRATETRTWIAEEDGAWWIEAANPERVFLQDVQRDPHAELRRRGRWRTCRAEVVPNPDGHARIRRLLRERYGWADRWIALLADTSRSVAVRVDCPIPLTP